MPLFLIHSHREKVNNNKKYTQNFENQWSFITSVILNSLKVLLADNVHYKLLSDLDEYPRTLEWIFTNPRRSQGCEDIKLIAFLLTEYLKLILSVNLLLCYIFLKVYLLVVVQCCHYQYLFKINRSNAVKQKKHETRIIIIMWNPKKYLHTIKWSHFRPLFSNSFLNYSTN